MVLNFEHSQQQLRNIAKIILNRALELGAASAQVQLNENIEKSVEVLNGNIENFETSYDSSMGLTVYLGHNRASVGISQVPVHDLDNVIQQALAIAKYTEADPDSALPDKDLLVTDFQENLDLYNPIELTNQYLIERAKNIESLGLNFDKQITGSDGAAVNLSEHNFVIANSNGLNSGYKTTRYNTSLSLIADSKSGMQTDYWYTSSREFKDLFADEQLAAITAKRLLRRLSRGSIKAGSYSVIFDQPIAKSIIGNFLGAISGGNLYRQLSFLNNSLGTQVFPDWLTITEDPFIIKGLASCYFDNEGVAVKRRDLVKNGVVNGYLLSSYTARKLKMPTTGNAGGNHNIKVNANFSGDIYKLAAKLSQGLIILDTIGHGVNTVTGDYSFGASALWVEDGTVQFFADKLTIAGNLKVLFKNIQYVSDDIMHGSLLCGSMLVDGVNVSV